MHHLTQGGTKKYLKLGKVSAGHLSLQCCAHAIIQVQQVPPSFKNKNALLKMVDKHGIRSHITTVTLDDVPKLPEMYMDPHLKGRLVMKIES